MIENKEEGLLIAENDDEKTWWNVFKGAEQEIKNLKLRNDSARKDIKLGAREIEQKFKAGAKEVIKRNIQSIMVQQEIMKLAKSKL